MRSVLAPLGTYLALLCGGALAAPCSDDRWQPTFVHDLEYPDGPWFVAGGSFSQLQGDSATWQRQACDLIGRYGLRDRRGFTTCQQYTDVQCGCSRGIRGNSTCANFLSGRGAPTVPGAMGVLEYDTDRAGSDLNNPYNEAPASTPEACRARCEQDGRCKAFTWVRPGQQGPAARCWIKGALAPATRNPCCVSGARAAGGGGGAGAGGKIVVGSASYGGNCGAALDVVRSVAAGCEGKPQCAYLVDHRVLGDPAVGCRKDFVARYQCAYGLGQAVRTASLDGEASGKTAYLRCN